MCEEIESNNDRDKEVFDRIHEPTPCYHFELYNCNDWVNDMTSPSRQWDGKYANSARRYNMCYDR